MAFENLFIRTKKSLGGIQLDAIVSESHNNIITLSKNPVELGAEITDHAIVEPKTISIKATVSDTPLGVAALAQIIDTVTGLFGTSTSQNITRSNAAYNALVALQDAREPIDIQTKLKLYQDMVITNISTVQDKDSSRAVVLNIVAKEVRIVETEIVTLQPDTLEGDTKEQASSAENKGRQEPVEPSASNESSILKSVADWLSGND